MASGYALPQGPNHGRGFHTVSLHSPNEHHDQHHELPSNPRTSSGNGYGSMHSHKLPMKGRVRGESDLSRPAGSYTSPSQDPQSSLRREILTGTLFALQYALFHESFEHMLYGAFVATHLPSGVYEPVLLYTGLITASILSVTGVAGYLLSHEEQSNKRRASDAADKWSQKETISAQDLGYGLRTVFSIGLPIYASLRLADPFVGLLLLAAFVSTSGSSPSEQKHSSIMQRVAKSKWYWSAVALTMLAELIEFTSSIKWHDIFAGYACITASTALLPPPLLDVSMPDPRPTSRLSTMNRSARPRPRLVATKLTSTVTALSGLGVGIVTLMAAIFTKTTLHLSFWTFVLGALGCAATCLTILFGDAASLLSRRKAGLWSGFLVGMLSFALIEHYSILTFLPHCAVTLLIVFGAIFDSSNVASDKASANTGHRTQYANVSSLTAFLLSKTQSGSLIHEILCEKDSRRIAYFTFLNFAFMLVQGFYGWVSGSLGLLSDTVHMFFDCLALIVGLAASVASKWPTSPEKPYGWSKLNTLAGFGNGVFLMLVSVEFVWGAIEGIMERNELRHVEELLVVSTLGLIVNMIGLLAFGHAHAGHDHGHGHSHNHGHSHAHSHAHSHSHDNSALPQSNSAHAHTHSHHDHTDHDHAGCNGHDHDHEHEHDPSHGHSHSHSHSSHDHDHHHHTHSHSYVPAITSDDMNSSLYPPSDPSVAHPHSGHENENMHGIYLHIAADAGGSLAVIISTTLTLWKPWYLWDPLATIIIAALIFMAAVPLVKESAKKLLLVIPAELEYELKSALQELGMLRGVMGFAVPRFWIEDKEVDTHGHHHHGHSHTDHHHGQEKGQIRLRGAIHVFVSNAADIEDVRERAGQFFEERQMDVVVQVEREGEGRCWCGGGPSSGI